MARPPQVETQLATHWAELAHIYTLDALMSETAWTTKDVAFHGGTSLHLSWRSPRFSEDLDFLLSKDVGDLDRIMIRVSRRLSEIFLKVDPLISVEITPKSKDPDRMPWYRIALTHREKTGSVKVKVEFWRVDRSYLLNYPTEFRTPLAAGDVVSRVTQPIPAATLQTAYCDKLTAFATRPRLKWRDIFDMWWIATQTTTTLDVETIGRQFLHNVSAYTTIGGRPPADVFRDFLAEDAEKLSVLAGNDLKRWLPQSFWHSIQPNGPTQMVEYVRHSLAIMSKYLDDFEVPEDKNTLKYTP